MIKPYSWILIALLAVYSSAGAVEVELSGVNFADGGRAEGRFTFDTDTETVTDWNISVSGGGEDEFPAISYTTENGTTEVTDAGDPQKRITFRITGSTRELRLTPSAALSGGGVIPLNLNTANGGAGALECFACDPARSITGGSLVAGDAVAFVLGPWLNGSWFNPDTSGQGIFIDVFSGITLVFMAWFTYDTSQPPDGIAAVIGHPGHRWLTAQGPFDGDTARLDVTLTSGGLFDDSTPTSNSEPGSYGTITLQFSSCREGTLSYDFPGLGLQGSFPLSRISNDNVAFCENASRL